MKKRLPQILALTLATAAVAAPAAPAKSLEPGIPPEARAAQSSDPGEAPALMVVGGAAALLAGGALVPRRRRRPVHAAAQASA